MTGDLVLGGLVVPGVVAAIVAAVWSLLRERALRELEGRLARQAEAFRLAQSPRVEAALELWGATSELERATRNLVLRFDPLHLPEDAPREEVRLAFLEHEEAARAAVAEAFRRYVAARARAECLLPPGVYEAVTAVGAAVEEAGDRYWLSRRSEPGEERRELRRMAATALDTARARRAEAVAALREAIDARA
jgi:hypothetical protein